jgi:serine protease inhibitor ecotin
MKKIIVIIVVFFCAAACNTTQHTQALQKNKQQNIQVDSTKKSDVAKLPNIKIDTTKIVEIEKPKTVNVDVNNLEVGHTVYAKNCSGCHRLFNPNEFDYMQWQPILQRMFKKAKVEDKTTKSFIANYIAAKCKKV